MFMIIFIISKYYLKNLSSAVRIRLIIQNLGGAFVKFGQMLALRSDLISSALAYEFLNLLDRMPPIPKEEIRATVRQELGKEIEEIFLYFEFSPLATASFAQVHRAVTFTSEQVVVKVQRPEIIQILKSDFEILRFLARLIDFFGYKSPVRAKDMFNEFAKWTWRELDYLLEAKNAENLRIQQKYSLETKFPKIFWQYTTKKILVEEFIEGTNIKNLLLVNKLMESFDPKMVSHRLVENAMLEYFLCGRFHADPHAGNIIVNGNSIGYVDFGIVGEGTLEQRIAMANFVKNTVDKNYAKAITAFLHLGLVEQFCRDLPYLLGDGKFTDLFIKGLDILKQIITKHFAKIVNLWHETIGKNGVPFSEKSAAKVFLKFLRIARIYRISLNPQIVIFIKTLIAVDAISLTLNPQFNLVQTIRQVFNQPQYVGLFSPESTEILNNRLAQLDKPVAKKDPDKTQKLKDYYKEWFFKLAEKHEREFRVAFKMEKEKITNKKPTEINVGKEKLPNWIIDIQQSLKH